MNDQSVTLICLRKLAKYSLIDAFIINIQMYVHA